MFHIYSIFHCKGAYKLHILPHYWNAASSRANNNICLNEHWNAIQQLKTEDEDHILWKLQEELRYEESKSRNWNLARTSRFMPLLLRHSIVSLMINGQHLGFTSQLKDIISNVLPSSLPAAIWSYLTGLPFKNWSGLICYIKAKVNMTSRIQNTEQSGTSESEVKYQSIMEFSFSLPWGSNNYLIQHSLYIQLKLSTTSA